MELLLAPLLVAYVFTRARESITAPALLDSLALATYARVIFHCTIAFFQVGATFFLFSRLKLVTAMGSRISVTL